MQGSQTLKLEQQTSYDKKVTYELFEIAMEWLEKYIEIAYKKEFPDWEKSKQKVKEKHKENMTYLTRREYQRIREIKELDLEICDYQHVNILNLGWES